MLSDIITLLCAISVEANFAETRILKLEIIVILVANLGRPLIIVVI